MAPCVISMPKSPRNASPDVEIARQVRRYRNEVDNKGNRRTRPLTSSRWTAMHRRDVILDRLRSIRNTRLQAKASRNLEEFMRDLRLPFLAPSLLDDNTSRMLAKLRWTLDHEHSLEPLDYQQPARYLNSHSISSVLPEDGYYGPYDRHLNRKVVMFVSRVNSISSSDYLQVPSSWPVFEDVPWNDTSMFEYIAVTNSSEPEQSLPAQSRRKTTMEGLSDLEDSEHGWSSEEYAEHPLKCHPCRMNGSRYRLYWDFLTGLPPAGFCWRHQDPQAAIRRAAERHAGRFDFNHVSLNKDIWPQVAGSELLHVLVHTLREDSHLYPLLFANETLLEHRFGRLVANVVATDAFPLQSHQSVQWLVGLMGPSAKTPDYSCRVTPKEMGWTTQLCPLLFAAQYEGGDYEQARASLASAFHPMMILMLLYYLDTRTCAKEPLPAWMVLFGVIYNERGLTIHAHYPEIMNSPNDPLDPNTRAWGARSYKMGLSFKDFSAWPMTRQPYILGTLYRIQGQCKHVLETCSMFLK